MEIVQFGYENQEIESLCKQAVVRIKALRRKTIEDIALIGQELTTVQSTLRHGQFTPWLDAYFGWTKRTAQRYMKVAAATKKNKSLFDFWCVTGLLKYLDLPPASQKAVIEEKAYLRTNDFERVSWRAAVEEHLEDCDLDHGRRCGDVLHAIEDARDDPVLGPVAEKLYRENRERFALLADRTPAEMDAETGIDTREPAPSDDNRPAAQFVQEEGAYLLFERTGNGDIPFDELERLGLRFVGYSRSHIRMWPGPHPLAVFPKPTNDAPGASWITALENAGCKRVGAKAYNGEVL